jgi:hypothetical protein
MTKSEGDNREDDVLRQMLKTPPKAHADMKHPRVKKPKPSRTGRRGRPKKAASTSASKADDAS